MSETVGPEPGTVLVSFDGSLSMKLDEVWPDGDAPANPTAEDVAAEMRKAIAKEGRANFLRGWMLIDSIEVNVYRDGEAAEV